MRHSQIAIPDLTLLRYLLHNSSLSHRYERVLPAPAWADIENAEENDDGMLKLCLLIQELNLPFLCLISSEKCLLQFSVHK